MFSCFEIYFLTWGNAAWWFRGCSSLDRWSAGILDNCVSIWWRDKKFLDMFQSSQWLINFVVLLESGESTCTKEQAGLPKHTQPEAMCINDKMNPRLFSANIILWSVLLYRSEKEYLRFFSGNVKTGKTWCEVSLLGCFSGDLQYNVFFVVFWRCFLIYSKLETKIETDMNDRWCLLILQ